MTRSAKIVFPEKELDRLEVLQAKIGAGSLTEVVSKALMILESLVDNMEKGVVFTAARPNGEVFEVEWLVDVAPKRPNLRLVPKDPADMPPDP